MWGTGVSDGKSPELELLRRFESATGLQFVQAHYSGFPLDAKILKSEKMIAVAQIAIKSYRFAEHTHFMQTIWKQEEAKTASAEQRVPFLIIAKFSDCDALYEFDAKHKFERRDGKDKTARERHAIAGSVFIPMTYWRKFEQWKGPAKAAPQTDVEYEEVEL